MTTRILPLLASLILTGALAAAAADAPPARTMRIDPSSTRALFLQARLSVEPLTRTGESLRGRYRVEVSPLSFGNEAGTLAIGVSGEGLRRLAAGEQIDFTGEAVSSDGNRSAVRGTATPEGAGSSGALRIHIASKKGKLVFHTSYHLEP